MNEIKKLFNYWNDLNTKIEKKLGSFEMTDVKKLRREQSKTEDTVYELLKTKAPAEIAEILPEKCGEMEIGLNTQNKEFYFVMEDIDPKSENLMAIVLGIDEKVSIIKNFDFENF